jgi:hypothetical protein
MQLARFTASSLLLPDPRNRLSTVFLSGAGLPSFVPARFHLSVGLENREEIPGPIILRIPGVGIEPSLCDV